MLTRKYVGSVSEGNRVDSSAVVTKEQYDELFESHAGLLRTAESLTNTAKTAIAQNKKQAEDLLQIIDVERETRDEYTGAFASSIKPTSAF
jgi:hypothetical protein